MMRGWVLLAVVACGCRNQDGEVAYLGSNTTTTVQGRRVAPSGASKDALFSLSALGWDLATASGLGKGEMNSAVSVVGFAQSMALMANAADGETRERLTELLHVVPGELDAYNEAHASLLTALHQEPSVTLANSVWCVWPLPIRAEYSEVIAPSYWAKVVNLGSAGQESVSQINTWSDKQTKGRFPRLFDVLDPQTAAVFCSAHAAIPAWDDPFPAPEPRGFRSSGREFEVATLSDTRAYSGTMVKGVQFAVLASGSFESTFVLPRSGQSLDSLVAELSQDLAQEAEAAYRPQGGLIQFPQLNLAVENSFDRTILAMRGGSVMRQPDLRYLSHELEGGFKIGVSQRVIVELAPGSGGTSSSQGEKSGTVTPASADFVANRPFLVLIAYRYEGRKIPLIFAAINDPR
ncbi:MAG: serpin family protein [Fimbriimonadaceae bacterium]